MNKKTLSFILLITMSLSACGTKTPTVTETPQEPPTATLVPATETSVATTNTSAPSDPTLPTEDTPTPASTTTPAPPENPADCTNAGKFISDVTIPDDSEVNIGETFTKTWRVQNTGTCIWWEGYSVTHYSEGSFGAPEKSPLPRTNPGEYADVSVVLVAPSVAGFYRGNFVIQNPAGLPMALEGDSRLWLIFNAVDNGTTVVDATATVEENETVLCDFELDGTRRDGVFAAINTYRAESGLPPYTINQELSDAAQVHAEDMACNNLFVHIGSDGSTPEDRADEAGYTGVLVTENVYGSNPALSPEEVKEWWRLDTEEPEHNKNLISTKYTDIGIGYAFFDNFGYYVVVFGQGE